MLDFGGRDARVAALQSFWNEAAETPGTTAVWTFLRSWDGPRDVRCKHVWELGDDSARIAELLGESERPTAIIVWFVFLPEPFLMPPAVADAVSRARRRAGLLPISAAWSSIGFCEDHAATLVAIV